MGSIGSALNDQRKGTTLEIVTNVVCITFVMLFGTGCFLLWQDLREARITQKAIMTKIANIENVVKDVNCKQDQTSKGLESLRKEFKEAKSHES